MMLGMVRLLKGRGGVRSDRIRDCLFRQNQNEWVGKKLKRLKEYWNGMVDHAPCLVLPLHHGMCTHHAQCRVCTQSCTTPRYCVCPNHAHHAECARRATPHQHHHRVPSLPDSHATSCSQYPRSTQDDAALYPDTDAFDDDALLGGFYDDDFDMRAPQSQQPARSGYQAPAYGVDFDDQSGYMDEPRGQGLGDFDLGFGDDDLLGDLQVSSLFALLGGVLAYFAG